MNRLLYFLIAFFGTSALLRTTYSPVFVPVQAQVGASMASLSSYLTLPFVLISSSLVILVILIVDLNSLAIDSR